MNSTLPSARPLALAAAALLALSACDKPKSRTVNDQGGPLGPTSATSNPGAAAPAAQGAPAGPPTSTDPLPDMPKWFAAYKGKTIKDLFPDQSAACVGNTDDVKQRYNGAFSPGVRIEGWGWDKTGKKVIERILLTDDQGKVVGAGETGVPRPDVTAARKDVTSPTTGWYASAPQTTGGLYAFGLIGDAKACKLGHINL